MWRWLKSAKAAENQEGIRPGRDVLDRLFQAQQRAGLLLRKFVSMCGTNNCDHQARICHSTTVAGVANTWGYGAMTNSYNDAEFEGHFVHWLECRGSAPVSMLHILHAKETGAKVIVVDPRFTRTAAKADHPCPPALRRGYGADQGVLRHIFENGWDDKDYIEDRVYGMDKVRDEATKWTAGQGARRHRRAL